MSTTFIGRSIPDDDVWSEMPKSHTPGNTEHPGETTESSAEYHTHTTRRVPRNLG
jgi:hypothetical protein